MAKLAEAFVVIKAKTAAFKKQLTKLKVDFTKISENMQKMGREMAIGITAPLFAALTAVTKAAITQEKADRLLAKTLKTVGEETDAAFKKMKKLASAIQEVTIHGDEDTQAVIALGLNMGITVKQMELAIKTSIGLSQQFERLNSMTAMQGVALALQGNTELLQRYVVDARVAGTQTEKLAAVLESGAKGFEQAKEEAKTTAGQIKQAGNDFGDAGEKLGEALLPNLRQLANLVSRGAKSFQTLSKETQVTILKWTGLLILAGPLLTVFGKLIVLVMALGKAFKFLTTWIIAAKLATLGTLLNKAAMALGLFGRVGTGIFTAAFVAQFAAVAAAIAAIGFAIKRTVGQAMQAKSSLARVGLDESQMEGAGFLDKIGITSRIKDVESMNSTTNRRFQEMQAKKKEANTGALDQDILAEIKNTNTLLKTQTAGF